MNVQPNIEHAGWDVSAIADGILQGWIDEGEPVDNYEDPVDIEEAIQDSYWTVYSRDPDSAQTVSSLVRTLIKNAINERI